MSGSLDISSSTGDYSVRVTPDALSEFATTDEDRILICDEFFEPFFASRGVRFISIPARESQKSLDAIPELIARLRGLQSARSTRIVAVGGGIVQDVSAFCASIYMRGVPWTYVPTTLLGMVDSCIGGKSSINVGSFKNLVGTFYPPTEVVIDPQVTATLSADQWTAGLCEAAKITFCRGDAAYEDYLACLSEDRGDMDRLSMLIAHSLQCKKWFIEIDEFDRGERLLLNLGHTFGHGIESASVYRISHGVAVGIGIVAALRLSVGLGVNIKCLPVVQALEEHILDELARVPELKLLITVLDSRDVVESIAADKKHTPSQFTFITVSGTGRAELRRLPKSDEARAAIADAVELAIDAVSAAME